MTEALVRLPAEELQSLFLFEALEADQLAWLSETGRVEQRVQGHDVFSEGDPATCFFVLLSGTLGESILVWQYAAAVAGHLLGVDPFHPVRTPSA